MPANQSERPHIYWRRLKITGQRGKPERKNVVLPQPPLRPNQAGHGASVSSRTSAAFEELAKQQQAIGVDPKQLLVLEMELLHTDQRESLEKLGLQILGEEEVRDELDQPIYANLIAFSSATDRRAFERDFDQTAHAALAVRPTRGSAGKPHDLRVEVHFADLPSAKAFREDEVLSRQFKFESKGPPKKVSDVPRFRLIVQFPTEAEKNRFINEGKKYAATGPSHGVAGQQTVLSPGERANLLDAIDAVRALMPEDRQGRRLRAEGVPQKNEFAIDVDLWHPGSTKLALDITSQLEQVVSKSGGRITDRPYSVADSMYLARVKGNAETLRAILQFPYVSIADLPPDMPSRPLSIFDADAQITTIPPAPADAPLACVVDSGVVAGHPLLAGWVRDERDFDSGEDTVTDQAGHGTHTAGIVVYGDIHACIQSGVWEPRVEILSAKVLKDNGSGLAIFSDDSDLRVETQLRNAITAFNTEYGCRVFNLSLGHFSRTYLGGRQLPWAAVLDEVARQLDVVLVISAGNVTDPELPKAATSDELRQESCRQLLRDSHALIDPATSMIALSVGAIARQEKTRWHYDDPDRREPFVAAPAGGPSPFTRAGLIATMGAGVARSVKPELVAYGGNYHLSADGRNWMKNDFRLGEPSLRHDFVGNRLLKTANGTSVAAPFVTHVCALIEHRLRTQFGDSRPISANLIRALAVHSALIPGTTRSWLRTVLSDDSHSALRLVGYGLPNIERALSSADGRVVLMAQDELEDEYYHIYELEIPDEFDRKGERFVRVTLAYDPPVRGTRKEYLIRRLCFRPVIGESLESIQKSLDLGKECASPSLDPKISYIERSTIQSASFRRMKESKKESTELLHVVVRSDPRLRSDESTPQRYALVVSLEHSDPNVRIYERVNQRVSVRARHQWS